MPPLPKSRDIKKLVKELGGGETKRAAALATLTTLCAREDLPPDGLAMIAGAGTVPPLVHLLLRKESPVPEKNNAAVALSCLAFHPSNAITIAAAGAIRPLVQLLGPKLPCFLQQNAAGALMRLALNAENKVAIAAAGAIPRLVKLIEPRNASETQQNALTCLANLATTVENAKAICEAGGLERVIAIKLTERDETTQMLANKACKALCDSKDAQVRAAYREATARGKESDDSTGNGGADGGDMQPRVLLLTICEL